MPEDGPSGGRDTSATTSDAVRRLEREGFVGQFRVTDEGPVQCLTCRDVAPPEAFAMARAERVEGTSDPSAESIILALVCPKCGAKGTVALPYGPGATPGEAQMLERLRDERRGPATRRA